MFGRTEFLMITKKRLSIGVRRLFIMKSKRCGFYLSYIITIAYILGAGFLKKLHPICDQIVNDNPIQVNRLLFVEFLKMSLLCFQPFLVKNGCLPDIVLLLKTSYFNNIILPFLTVSPASSL